MGKELRLHFFRVIGSFLLVVFLAGSGFSFWQRYLPEPETNDNSDDSAKAPADQFEYVFTRLAHYSPSFGFTNGHTWNTDYPKADRQFLQGVLRWTSIQARRQEQVLRPLDPQLFGFPFLYAVEVGYLRFSDEE